MKRGIACASRSDASGAAAAVPSHPSSTSPGGQPGASPAYSALNALHSSLTASGSTPSVVHISTANLNRIRPVQPLHLTTQNLLLNRPPSTTRYNQVAANPVYNSLNLSLNKAQGVTQSVASVAQTVSLGIASAGHTQTVSLGQIHAPAVTSASAVNVSQAVTGAAGHQIVYSSRVAQRIQTNTQIPSVQTTYNSGVNTVTAPKQQQQQSAAGTTAVTSEAPIGMQSALSHYQPSVQVVSAYAAGSGTTGPGRPQAVSTATVKPVIQVRQKVHVTTTNSPPSTPVVFQIQAQATTTSSPPSVINTPSLSVAVATPQAAVGHHVGAAPSPMVVHTSKSPTVTHHSQSMPGHVVHTPHHTSLVVASMGTHHGQNATTQITNTQQNSLGQSQQQSNTSFQRLKVEDALSYLDKVKYKFGDQPQVYNDFLDIMKEFKSQSIDTPGVIERVSNLFKEHPELIEGFNTFLPPGYKIEVKPVDQGYSYQVSVSMPSPTQSTTTLVHTQGPGQRLSSPPMTGGQNANAVSQPQSAKSTSVMQIMQGSNIIHTTMAAAANIASGTPSQSQASSGAATAPQPASGSAAPAPHQATAAAPQASPVHAAPASGAALHHHYQPIGSGNIQHSNNNVHHSISQAQAHQAVSQALSQVETGHSTPQNQPVEFNHAINYVNKIKNRFQGQPEKYKRFLEILHTYQKEQRNSKEPLPLGGANAGGGAHTHSNLAKHLTEAEVYSQVAKLFENQEDLLAEFGRFLPDANHHCALVNKSLHNDTHPKKPAMKPASYNSSAREHEREGREREHRDREHRDTYDRERDYRDREKERGPSLSATQKYGHSSGQVKRNLPYLSQPTRSSIIDSGPPLKKHKVASCRDVTFAEASKYGTLSDYAYFDKVRKALRSQEVYDNFLRCLVLYNEEIISRSELVQLVVPFLGKFPELFRWFKDFVGHSESGVEPISNNVARQERPQGELAMEVDLNTCKRLGASYCALPKAQADATYSTSSTGTTGISGLPPGAHIGSLASRRCSGRTPLCREVLNDTWVSFPTWSEDSTFVTNRKTQFEEYIYRCEDERFELDVVIETNASTIRVLEGVCRRLQRLSPDELQRFRLDDTLGGTSAVLHQRALRRIYGDKAPDIVDGLKRNPAVAVPVVLRRLKAKEDEWREAQKGFNKIWREQNEKYYLKSLDHQGINFKQNDIKLLRSKSLFNEIETIYDERHEQSEEGAQSAVPGSTAASGPHLILSYSANLTPNSSTPANPVISSATTTGTTNNVQPTGPVLRSVLDDAAGLLIHHVRRQTGAQKQEKARIKALLRQFIPDLFHHPRQQLSDDERDDDDDKEDDDDEDKVKTSPKNASRKSPDTVGAADVKTEKKCSAGTSGTDVPMDVDGMEDVDLSAVKTEEDEHDPLYSIKNDPDEYYTLFIANSNWYLFLRLHAILCSRLATIQAHAQRLAEIEAAEQEKRKQSTAIALRLKPQPEAKVEKYYPAFLEMVKNLLDGNLDANTYEDTLREMFGIHAYIAFTLDKVVSYAVRQLQHCASERSAIECCSLFLNERRKAHPAHSGGTNRRDASFREKDFFKSLGKDIYSFTRGKSSNSDSGTFNSSGAGGPCATAYWRRAAEGAYQRTVETKIKNENCFKLYIYKNSLRVTMELIVYESDDADPQTTVSEAKKWSEYVEGFSNDGTGISLSSGEKSAKESSRSSGGRTGSSDQDSADHKNNEAGGGGDTTEKGRKRTTDGGDKAPKEEKGLSDQEGSENGVESILGTWSNRRAMFLKRNLRKFRQRAQRVASASSSTQNASPASSGGPSGGGSSSSTSEDAARPPTERRTSADKDDDDNDNEISELERKLAEKGVPERMNSGDPSATSDYVVDDKAQCRFNLNSYKMVYIVNKDTYLYKKGALTKAKESHLVVTKNLGSRFKAWHKKWINQHVLETQQKTTYDWLMGRSEGLCSNRTRVLSNNDTRRTPYVPYNRYRVERLPPAVADMEIG